MANKQEYEKVDRRSAHPRKSQSAEYTNELKTNVNKQLPITFRLPIS